MIFKSIKKVYFDVSVLSLEALEPYTVGQTRVHLDNEGCLIWPVMFLYPEYKVTDLIEEFHEDTV